MRTLLVFLICFYALNAKAQSSKSTTIISEPPVIINVPELKDDYNPVLQHIEMPSPGTGTTESELDRLKKESKEKYKHKKPSRKAKKRSGALPNQQLKGFRGNIYNSRIPNDNNLAISNNGMLVSVINSTIYMYDTNADTVLKIITLGLFAQPLAITASKFDPKVVYDPREDRFILVYLNGFTFTSSKIIVAYSQTNNPAGAWNLYALSGNPISNDTWSDYPVIGISATELFIGMNTFYNGSTNNSGFVESCLWQIGNINGYKGLPLNSQYYSGILPAGEKQIFNITPMQGGNKPSGPNMYLLSNRNLSLENDTIFLLEVTDTIASPSRQLNIKTLLTPDKYFFPPDANQPSGHTLKTNDSRVLGGFYENGRIQFVQSALDTVTLRPAIYHGEINNPSLNPVLNGSIISSDTLDFGFPNIAYSGLSQWDNSAVITYNYSDTASFAGFGSMSYNGKGDYSDHLTLKSGFNYMDAFADGVGERWGDYTGAQRKYNEPGVVWANGSYGDSLKKNQTWISKIQSPGYEVSIKEPTVSKNSNIKVFPNPLSETVSITFSIAETKPLTFSITDFSGKQVKLLMEEQVKAGINAFTFSTGPLSSGIYFIQVTNGSEVVASQKVVKN